MSELLTVREVARVLKLSTRQVWKLRASSQWRKSVILVKLHPSLKHIDR